MKEFKEVIFHVFRVIAGIKDLYITDKYIKIKREVKNLERRVINFTYK